MKPKQFVQKGRAPSRPSRALGNPARTPGPTCGRGVILAAERSDAGAVCVAIRRTLMQIQGDLIFLTEDLTVSHGPQETSGNHSRVLRLRRAVVSGHERYAKQFVSCIYTCCGEMAKKRIVVVLYTHKLLSLLLARNPSVMSEIADQERLESTPHHI